jgi:IclR family acetate operon transcriptional repressor
LRELADECRHSVLLAILDGNYLLYVYAIESRSRLLARTAVGDRVPLHCTAIGKAILTTVGMAPSTEATITDLTCMHKELELTRQRGYSLDSQEHEPSTFCIGAPIFEASGRIIAACSISGTDPEIIRARLEPLAQLVVQCAGEISRLLGYIPARQALVARRTSIDARLNR